MTGKTTLPKIKPTILSEPDRERCRKFLAALPGCGHSAFTSGEYSGCSCYVRRALARLGAEGKPLYPNQLSDLFELLTLLGGAP